LPLSLLDDGEIEQIFAQLPVRCDPCQDGLPLPLG
jgi:hypothetical protein